MPRRFAAYTVTLLALVAVLVPAANLNAVTRSWLGASGDFGDPAHWTGGVPGANDSALFDGIGGTITFDNDPNLLANPVLNRDLTFNNSTVTLASGADGIYTYHLTGGGGDDVNLIGGTVTLGTGIVPLNLTADDDLVVRGNGTLNINVGSQVNAAKLLMGHVASGGNGTVFVDGTGGTSTLNISGDTTLGSNNFDATLTYRDGAVGNLSTLGTVRVGVDSGTCCGGTQGVFSVQTSSDVVVGNIEIGTGTFGSGQVIVQDTGSTVQHAWATSLTIGNAIADFGGGGSGSLNVVGGATYSIGSGTTAIRGQGLLQLDGGTFTTAGPVNVNTTGDPGTHARIDLNSQSLFQQTGAAGITIGAASGGTATIAVDFSTSTFTTGTGLLTINKTGVLDLNGGAFNANGDVLINGGILDRGGSATFNLAPGHELTIQNGGRASFSGIYAPAANSITTITGSTSRIDSTGAVSINNGAEVRVMNGGTILNSVFGVGNATVGKLLVDGFGSSIAGFSTTNWGELGGAANVIFSNRATGTFSGSLNLANSSNPNTTAVVTVESGAKLTTGSIFIAQQGGSTTSATLDIRGAGSSVTLGSSTGLTIGHSTTGTATVNVSDGAALTVGSGGGTTLNTTGRINITGGTVDLKNLTQNGGKITFTSGSLSYQGNLTVGTTGLLGSTVVLNSSRSLAPSGATIINAGALLLVEGGTLSTNSINNLGEFRVAGQESSISVNSVTNSGMLRGDGRVSGVITNSTTGDIRVNAGDQLHFTGTSFSNGGDVVAIGTAVAPAELMIDGAATNAAGTGLIVGRDAILQFDAGLSNGGALALNLGVNDVFGDISNTGSMVVTGGSHATFYDDVVQNGTLTVSAVGATTSVAVFFGDFSGTGGSSGGGDIFFEGDLRPGASPAEVTYSNNVYFGGGTNLEIEVGGLTAGTQHDKVNVGGALTLDGTLEVSLTGDFHPQIGDEFDILDFNPATLSGTFKHLDLDPLSEGLAWDTSDLYTTGVLSIVSADLLGDYNHDTVVDAADYVMWRHGAALEPGYTLWAADFGNTVGGGSAAASPSQTGVPEPISLMLLLASVVPLALIKRR